MVQISLERAFEDGDFIKPIVKLISFYNEKDILAPMMISVSEESKDGRVSLSQLLSMSIPNIYRSINLRSLSNDTVSRWFQVSGIGGAAGCRL